MLVVQPRSGNNNSSIVYNSNPSKANAPTINASPAINKIITAITKHAGFSPIDFPSSYHLLFLSALYSSIYFNISGLISFSISFIYSQKLLNLCLFIKSVYTSSLNTYAVILGILLTV